MQIASDTCPPVAVVLYLPSAHARHVAPDLYRPGGQPPAALGIQRCVLGSNTEYEKSQSVGITGHIFDGSSPAAVQQQMRVTELEDDSHVDNIAELKRQSPPLPM